MDTTAELTLVVLILALTGAAIPVVALFTDEYLYRGYHAIRSEARSLAGALKGKVSRRGEDLVVSGIHNGFPVELCISKSDYTPELAVKLWTTPLAFNIRVKPRTDLEPDKGSRLALRDSYLSSRFAAFSDGSDPKLAGFLVDSDAAAKELRRLCWSTRNYVFVTPQHVELIEPKLADAALAAHCLDVVGGMARLAAAAQELLGKSGARPRIRRSRHLLVRAAMGLAACIALAALLSTGNSRLPSSLAAPFHRHAEGVYPQDAPHIMGVANWRVAGASDFDPFSVQWLRQRGQLPSGRLAGDFSGASNSHDVAYVLRRADGSFRVVMLIGGAVAYDGTFPNVQVAAVIPKDRFGAIHWKDETRPSPAGDGLLIVMRESDVSSGVVLYRQAGELHAARAADYQSVSLD
jgi:hypothetical protein